MIYAIVGSRSFDDYTVMKRILDSKQITGIVSGGAYGADKLSERYAAENNIPMKIHYANWDKYGKAAGMIRNKYIIDDADVVVAFWDGKSKGTEDSIKYARKKQKELTVIKPEVKTLFMEFIELSNG